MAYKLDRKLKDLEFERKQVLQHLALLDSEIATIQQAIELMQQTRGISHYNTPHFTYRSRVRLFKGKIRKSLIQILRSKPDKGFTIAELTQRIFELEQNNNPPTLKHLDSVRKQLNVFYQQGWVTHTEISRIEVYWQWKTTPAA